MNKNKNIYVFYDTDKTCIAAIEQVIRKYKNKKWFNAALKKVVTDSYLQIHDNICKIPFFIIKYKNNKGDDKLIPMGYHYIIDKIEKYNNKYEYNEKGWIFNKYILSIIIIILIIIIFNIFIIYKFHSNII